MKKIGLFLLALLITGCSKNQEIDKEKQNIYKDGTYLATAKGYGGDFEVKVTLRDDKIIDIQTSEHHETPSIGGVAIEQMIENMKKENRCDVDIVSGATKSSQAMIEAVSDAMKSAKNK